MAKGSATEQISSNKMLECMVCLQVFTSEGNHVPRLFPCTDTLCEDCIKKLPVLKGGKIKCPECRKTFHAQNKAQSFPQNRYVLQLIDDVKIKQELETKAKKEEEKEEREKRFFDQTISENDPLKGTREDQRTRDSTSTIRNLFIRFWRGCVSLFTSIADIVSLLLTCVRRTQFPISLDCAKAAAELKYSGKAVWLYNAIESYDIPNSFKIRNCASLQTNSIDRQTIRISFPFFVPIVV